MRVSQEVSELILQVSKPASVKKLLDKMNKWYFEKHGEQKVTSLSPVSQWAWVCVCVCGYLCACVPADVQLQATVSQVYQAITLHSTDMAQNMMADFIPLVFVAMHATAMDEGVCVCVCVCERERERERERESCLSPLLTLFLSLTL